MALEVSLYVESLLDTRIESIDRIRFVRSVYGLLQTSPQHFQIITAIQQQSKHPSNPQPTVNDRQATSKQLGPERPVAPETQIRYADTRINCINVKLAMIM